MKKQIDSKQKKYWDTGGIFRSYKHPIMEFFIEQRINFINLFVPLHKVKSILDIGCGNGSAAYYFSKRIPFTVAGDISIDWQNFPLSYFHSIYFNAYTLSFNYNSFDTLNIWEALHHLTQFEKTMSRAQRVAKHNTIHIEYNP